MAIDATSTYLTVTFYKFVTLADFQNLQIKLKEACKKYHLKGLILLALEGINSTVTGSQDDVHEFLKELRLDLRFENISHKESWSIKGPFYRMKVRLRKEIVTLGIQGIKPSEMAGQYVKPGEWNELISDPNIVVIDTRNQYEVELGTFDRAINPEIKSFSQLPEWIAKNDNILHSNGKKKKVAMFCTGGIRCEKSTAYLRSQGFDEVYHLEGGILKYLETVKPDKSLWLGQCFVFDERVSVGHDLQPGSLGLCRACRQPISISDQKLPGYELGVSCYRCVNQTNESQKNSARERQRQWCLAKRNDRTHIGDNLVLAIKSDTSRSRIRNTEELLKT